MVVRTCKAAFWHAKVRRSVNVNRQFIQHGSEDMNEHSSEYSTSGSPEASAICSRNHADEGTDLPRVISGFDSHSGSRRGQCVPGVARGHYDCGDVSGG